MSLTMTKLEREWAEDIGGRWHRLIDHALSLYADGYKTVNLFDNVYKMISPKGNTYTVDAREKTCTCPAYENRMFVHETGTVMCKHTLGIELLVCNEKNEVFHRKMGWIK